MVDDLLYILQKLADVKLEGIVTDEEFQIMKVDLLADCKLLSIDQTLEMVTLRDQK